MLVEPQLGERQSESVNVAPGVAARGGLGRCNDQWRRECLRGIYIAWAGVPNSVSYLPRKAK